MIVAKGCVKSGQNIPCVASALDTRNILLNDGIWNRREASSMRHQKM